MEESEGRRGIHDLCPKQCWRLWNEFALDGSLDEQKTTLCPFRKTSCGDTVSGARRKRAHCKFRACHRSLYQRRDSKFTPSRVFLLSVERGGGSKMGQGVLGSVGT